MRFRLREREALIAQLAAAFINLPAELVNAEIESSFQQLLEFFDLDRISLFEFSAGTTRLRLLCSRTSRGVEQIPSVINLAQLPWTASQILRGTPIVASHLGELPEEASALKEVLRASGVQSFVAFPIQHSGNTFATVKFSTVHNEREWKPDLVQALQTIVDIFGSALERKYAEEADDQSRTRLSGIVESAMDAIIAVDSQQCHIVVVDSMGIVAAVNDPKFDFAVGNGLLRVSEGRGNGQIMAAAKIRFDKKKGHYEIESYGNQYIKATNVRPWK